MNTNLTPGQLTTAIMTLLSAVLAAVTAFAPLALNVTERAAISGVFAAAIPVGVYLFAYFRHTVALARSAAPPPTVV